MTRLSIIIPAFCEAPTIGAAVAAARSIGDEVIVVDGASPDGTASCAREAGAIVVVARKGRGAQLHAGALRASGDVLLFLHADARLPRGARDAVLAALSDATVVGGNFKLRFDPSGFCARLFAWVNHLRQLWLGIYYGDSAIFIRRSAYEALGGFRPLPIFEDYDLVRRMERAGRTRYIQNVEVVASARRFVHAPWRTLAIWSMLQILYSVGVPAAKLARFYADLR